jgi:polygalacturonase
MVKIAQYPRNADGTPMNLDAAVLVDATGNGGARLTNAPIGPDGAPIDTFGLVLMDQSGAIVSPGGGAGGAGIYVNVKDHAATGDGITNDTTNVQATIDLVSGAGGGTVFLPHGTYLVTQLVLQPNVRLLGEGDTSVILNTSAVLQGTLLMSNAGGKVDNLRFLVTGGSANPWHIDVSAADCTIQNCTFEKTEGTGGYQGYFRWGADGLRFTGNRSKGSNGFYLEASNVGISQNRFIARAVGGDDAIAIKAIQGVVHSIRIENNHFENHSDFVAIGSEVGTFGAAEPTHSLKGVRGVTISGNTGKNCSYGLFIKPGGGSTDYRDGFVRDVLFSHNILEDLTGAAFNNLIFMLPSRGGVIENVRGDKNVFRGRAVDTEASGYKAAVLLYTPDSATGGSPAITDVNLGVTVFDPYNGVNNGVGGAPGYPIVDFVAVRDVTAAGGAITRVHLDIRGNGSSSTGIRITTKNDDAVIIDRAELSNVNPLGGGAAIYSDSRYTLGEYRFVTVSAPFGGTGEIIQKQRVNARLHGVVGDGVTDDTAALQAVLNNNRAVHLPRGTYIASSLTIPANTDISTDGFGTVLKQKAATVAGTRLLVIAGGNVSVGDIQVEGQLNQAGDVAGEQNHGIFIQATAATGSFAGVKLGNILAKNIRGDALYIGSDAAARNVSQISFGDLLLNNIYRNGLSLVGGSRAIYGRSIRVAQGAASGAGYLTFDIEPDVGTGGSFGVTIESIPDGRFAACVPPSAADACDAIRIGYLNLDPGNAGGSVPAYVSTPAAALQIRNTTHIHVEKARITNHNGPAVRHIWNAGELAKQTISFGDLSADNCAITDVTNYGFVTGTADVVRLLVRSYRLTVTANKAGIINCNDALIDSCEAVNPNTSNGLFRACDRLTVKNLKHSGAGTPFISCNALRAIGGVVAATATSLASFADDAVFIGYNVTATTVLNTMTHARLMHSTINGTWYDEFNPGVSTIQAAGASFTTVFPNIQTVASAATVTPAFGNDLVVITAQAAALILANWTGTAFQGAGLVVRIKDNGTARAITYGTKYRAMGTPLPTTTVANKTMYFGFIYNSTDDKFDFVSLTQEP